MFVTLDSFTSLFTPLLFVMVGYSCNLYIYMCVSMCSGQAPPRGDLLQDIMSKGQHRLRKVV